MKRGLTTEKAGYSTYTAAPTITTMVLISSLPEGLGIGSGKDPGIFLMTNKVLNNTCHFQEGKVNVPFLIIYVQEVVKALLPESATSLHSFSMLSVLLKVSSKMLQ